MIEAFNDKDQLLQFFIHKIQTIPSNHNIPYAINQKFNYLDTACFRSFSRTKDTAPQHQKEFNSLYQIALEKYKKLHNVILINKFNRDQIHKKLKTKLALDYIQNSDFFTTSPHECTRHIFYCLNLAQISCALTFEETRKLLNEAHSQLLIPLPISPDQIDQSI